MVIDSSAFIAAMTGEPEAEDVVEALARSERTVMSSANWVETCIVLSSSRYGFEQSLIDSAREMWRIELVDFTVEHAELAISAWMRFGKGRHPARLNLADCYAFATAMLADDTLLFVGDGFAQTDVVAALA